MNNSFSDAYKNGSLSKKLFLESEITRDFIEWFYLLINENSKLNTIYADYDNLYECIKNYKWQKDLSFNNTLNRFKEWRRRLETSDESECKNICIEILKWGGVSSGNAQKIEKITSMKNFLKANTDIVSKCEITIDDFNTNYMSSGFTKIYTASNEDFIMYDGRVGSALCYLVKKYLEEKNISKVPKELEFGYGQGRSENKNRNPNHLNSSLHFSDITSSRRTHFISNIKANWLLRSIAEKVDIPGVTSINDKTFALQTALFVLGEKIPE